MAKETSSSPRSLERERKNRGSKDKTYTSKACSSYPLTLNWVLSNNTLIYNFISMLIEEASTLMMHLLRNFSTSWGPSFQHKNLWSIVYIPNLVVCMGNGGSLLKKEDDKVNPVLLIFTKHLRKCWLQLPIPMSLLCHLKL